MNADVITDTEHKITQTAVDSCSTNVIPANNVVIASRVGLGKVCLTSMPTAINQDLRGVLPKSPENLSVHYLYRWFQNVADQILAAGRGATVQGVTLPFLKSLRIPVPPLPEQQRIVGILDQAFEGIAKAKGNAERNLDNAGKLLAEELRTMLADGREGWLDTTIGEQITLQRGYDITKSQQRVGDIPVVSSSGVKSYHNEAKVRGPGVVIGRKGTLGSSFYLDGDFWPHDTSLYVRDFKGNNPRFVYYVFCGLDVKHLDSGAANPALNRNVVHTLPVKWPPTHFQDEICQFLDQLSEWSDRLSEVFRLKINNLNYLKTSLLHQAFSGNL